MARLVRNGGRRTANRRAIVEALVGDRGHMTAEDLAARVQTSFPSMSVSTVYRGLAALEALGVVDHVHLAHGPAVYHLAEDSHQHLVCGVCGRVEELPASSLRDFRRRVLSEHGFDISYRHFAIEGVCADCRGPARAVVRP